MLHEKNYHSTKLEFLALQWAVTEHLKEHLPYQSFVVQMDNNPLTYIMSTPNLDAVGHWWVGALAWFNIKLEYHKGHDNMVADVLSWVTTQLNPETVKFIVNGVALGMAHCAKVHDLAVVEGNQHLEQEVCVTTGCTLVVMHVTIWAVAQREDKVLSAVLDWLKAQKQTDLKMFLVEHTSSKEGKLILWNQQYFTIHQGALYLCLAPRGETEDLLLFVVPKAHHVTALNGCHWDAGHQGHGHCLCFLWKCFWWPEMTNQVQQSIKSYTHCLQHEGNFPRMPLYPIVSTAPRDLLHIDFTSIEMTMELNRLPGVPGPFHKMPYGICDPNQTTRVTSQSLGIWPGSYVIMVQTSWAALLAKCANSVAWRSCEPCPVTPR